MASYGLRRVRFAPSPTGHLHLGGLRTALYNYLTAKSINHGHLILRIEDTDRTRLVPGSINNIISHLQWANIQFDEGPFIQSERLHLYQKYAQLLISTGHAYKCFCPTTLNIDSLSSYPGTCRNLSTKEIAERNGNQFVIRFNSSTILNPPTSFYDHTFKTVNVNQPIEDFILLKSNGWPTYHLASVVDDHLMQITHVLRGHEWLPSTIKHILLYTALKWEQPNWVHLPLLLNKDGKKLSKRAGSENDFSVSRFKKHGYLPEVLLNFISLLGWTPRIYKNEMMSLRDMCDQFDLNKLHVSPAIVDPTRLDWLQKTHFSALAEQKDPNLVVLLRAMLSLDKEIPPNLLTDAYLSAVLGLISTRLHRIPDIVEKAKYFWMDPDRSLGSLDVQVCRDVARVALDEWQVWPSTQVELDRSISRIVHQCLPRVRREVLKCLRYLVTGTEIGAALSDTIFLLGETIVHRRLANYL